MAYRQHEPVRRLPIEDFIRLETRVWRALADGDGDASYRAEFERPTSNAVSEVQRMYVSSLWCLRDGEWTNVFGQDTLGDQR